MPAWLIGQGLEESGQHLAYSKYLVSGSCSTVKMTGGGIHLDGGLISWVGSKYCDFAAGRARLVFYSSFIHKVYMTEFTPLKWTVQWLFVLYTGVSTNFRLFSSAHKETLCTLVVTPFCPPPTPGTKTTFCLWVCLFHICGIYVNGAIQYVAFCVWRLSCSILFLSK